MTKTIRRRISAVMTVPRYGCNICRGLIETALYSHGIQLQTVHGAFWHEHFTALLESGCQSDWILTVDYDSLFSAKMVGDLLSRMATDKYDALAALQLGKKSGAPLFHRHGESTIQFRDQPFLVDSAHFGLTLLKVKHLLSLPRPWLQFKPDSEGRWVNREEKIDADIWFWKRWREAGHEVWINPTVRIGHLREMAIFLDHQSQPRLMYVENFAQDPDTFTSPWRSQLGQDKWVFETLGGKECGTFLDIGCGHPEIISNTYALEHFHHWMGVGIDIDRELIVQYKQERPDTRAICADATNFNWVEVFRRMPPVIDYLSLDLEPPQLAWEVLQKLPWEDHKFRTITFEHDSYRDGVEANERCLAARKFLADRGYRLAHETPQDDFFVYHGSEDERQQSVSTGSHDSEVDEGSGSATCGNDS